MKHPSSNIQAPEKLQIPNSGQVSVAVWSLELGDSLELGYWSLELFE
jgi:hypothetical protein